MTEAQAGRDKRLLRGLVLLRLRLLVLRGNTAGAAAGLKAWLADSETAANMGLMAAEASVLYASVLSSLAATAGTAPGDAGSAKVVVTSSDSLPRTAYYLPLR